MVAVRTPAPRFARLARRAVSLTPILQKVIALRSEACRAAGIEVVRHYGQKLPRDIVLPGSRNDVRERSVVVALHLVRYLLEGREPPR